MGKSHLGGGNKPMSALGMGILHGGNAVSELGNAFSQSRALQAQGEYQAAMLDFNATISLLQAEDAIERGQKEAGDYQKRISQLIGSQRTSYAAQGVVVGSGTAREVQEETALQGIEDA